jgi:hypothetical protein
MRIRKWVFAAAACAALSLTSLTFAGDVSGTVKLDGAAPEQKPIDMSGVQQCNDMHPDPVMEENVVAANGMLANVVVSVKKEDSPDLTGEQPKDVAMIDQSGCMYKPHVLAMMGGQDLVVKNSDNFLHNIHSLSEKNPSFNKAQPQKNDGEKMADAPKVPEYFHVKCDVHPWMSCYVAVFDHPFFSVSGADGKWTIKNLPDGDYTLHAWHEKLGEQDKKVTIKDGKPAEAIEFVFKAEAAMGPDTKDVILASDSGEKKDKDCDGSCCAVTSRAKAIAGK